MATFVSQKKQVTQKVLVGLALAAALALPACVTINIYFPAAAAEKAADKIIDEVWQLKQEQEGATKDAVKDAPPAEKPADATTQPAN